MAKTKRKIGQLKKPTASTSALIGASLTLIELALPMMGITVNLWLGAFLLLIAFAILASGVWNIERNRNIRRKIRILTLLAVGVVFFSLIVWQVHSQHKQKHQGAQQKTNDNDKDCSGTSGTATASGTGNVAFSGNCNSVQTATGNQKKGN